MKKRIYYGLIFVLLVAMSLLLIVQAYAAVTFQPLPFEDQVNGRNSYAYNPAIGHPTSSEQVDFLNSVKADAMSANSSYGIPASAIMGMAAVESGYGFTRIGYFANNLFGMKIWAQNPPNGWQLKGQPDENNGTVPILANYGSDRLVFDETVRYDNWYRLFYSRSEAINYLAGTFLMSSRYRPARDSYQSHLAAGWSLQDASKQYCYDIAAAGYNYLGGDYYRNKIGAVMDQWNLYQYDAGAQASPLSLSAISVSPIASDGYTVSGTVNISVTASNASKVEFYSANGTYLLKTVYAAPYTTSWATAGYVPNGEQILKVVAYDAAGIQTFVTKTVYVSNVQPPTIGAINISPIASDGYTVSGNVNLSVTATNATKVEFYSNNGSTLIGTSTVSPYNVNWSTLGLPNGQQTLKAIAYNSAGATAGTTKTVNVFNDNTAPSISSLDISPIGSDGLTVRGNITLTANVTDNVAVSKVEFYSNNGATLIGTNTAAPYSVGFSTSGLPDGDQLFKVAAYDAAGNQASLTRKVTIANNVTPTPWIGNITVSPMSRNGNQISDIVTISVTAGMSDGSNAITRVDFYYNNGANLIGTDSSAPYSVTWQTKGTVPNGDQTLKAVAYDQYGKSVETKLVVSVKNRK